MATIDLTKIADFTPDAKSARKTDATANVVLVALLRPDLNGKGVADLLRSQNAYDGATDAGIGVKVTTIRAVLAQLANGEPVVHDGKRYAFRPVVDVAVVPAPTPPTPDAPTGRRNG